MSLRCARSGADRARPAGAAASRYRSNASPTHCRCRSAALTLVKAMPFADAAAAADWLRQVAADEDIAGELTAEATRTVNRALLAHRVAAPDAYAGDLHHSAAVSVRFGYGSGQEVADGRWSEAYELPEAGRRSLRAQVIDGVGAQERVAAVLGGREAVGAEESLLIDAERAAAEGREPLAALTFAAALEALRRAGSDPGEAAAEVADLRERALSGRPVDAEQLRLALRAARRAIRAGISARG